MAKIPFISVPTKFYVCIKSSELAATNKGVACKEEEETPCENAAKGWLIQVRQTFLKGCQTKSLTGVLLAR